MKWFNLGDPEVVEFVEELNYPNFFNKVKNKIPRYLRLDHTWFDTLLHYYVGEWMIFGVYILTIFGDDIEHSIVLQLFFATLAIFLLAIPWLRKSAWKTIELTETEIKVFYHTFKWKNIEHINKIQTTRRHSKYGIQIILTDQTKVNIDLALRKPHLGYESEMFEYIYVFWRRGKDHNQSTLIKNPQSCKKNE